MAIMCLQGVMAQNKLIRPAYFGVSFIANDYKTAQLIRSSSLGAVLRDKSQAKFGEMSTGLAVHYFQGLTPHIDVAATLAGSFANNVLPNKSVNSNKFLLEGDISGNFKMFTENYLFTPYLIAGLGFSEYQNYYSAIIPLGGGFKFNLFDEAALFITTEYRIPITPNTNNYHFMHSFGVAGVIGQKKALEQIPAQ